MNKKILSVFFLFLLFASMTFTPVRAETPSSDITRILSDYAQTLPARWTGGGQCYGFAQHVYRQIFGVSVTWSYDTGESTNSALYCVESIMDANDISTLFSLALPGDILCWGTGLDNPHSTIVYDTQDGMVVLDANSDGAGIILINSTYTAEYLAARLSSGSTTRISLFRLSPGNFHINESIVDMDVGKTRRLEIQIDIPAYSPRVWTSSNPLVASVSDDGIITGNGVGSAVIVCSWGNRQAACSVNVRDGFSMASSVTLSPSTLFIRSEHRLDILQNEKTSYKDHSVVWASSDTDIASVSSAGLVVAKKPGHVIITASFLYNEFLYELSCDVYVVSPTQK